MIHRLRASISMLVACLGLLVATFASAQTYTLPQVGLQSAGSCPQFAVQDRNSKEMVPLGCLDARSKEWVLQPRKLMTGSLGAANLGAGSTVGPVMNADGTITMFGANKPANGTWVTNDASLKCEPILGPFHSAGSDLTRCQTARYHTAMGNENQGAYSTLMNLHIVNGFPSQCERNKFYPEFGTCLNNGLMYRVKEAIHDASGNVVQSFYGTTAASGSGPTGTGNSIVDGTVTWRYEPNFTPGNGGKTNLALMTYQDANAGAAWTGAFAHQIAGGGYKKSAMTLELDLNNYWGDYNAGPAGPSATILQLFTGGPYRSSKAIGIGQYDQPAAGQTALVNGIEFCCATLIKDNTTLDLTSSYNGYSNAGYHAGSAFTDSSSSQISFHSYGDASVGFRHGGRSAVGLQFQGSYNFFQVQGVGWNVNPSGVVTSSGLVVQGGSIKPAQYTVAGLFPCFADTKGSVVVVTDLSGSPTYRQPITAGGGSETALALCTGSMWVAH